MPFLEESRFLTELNKMYERHKTQGTVWVTMKRTNMRPGRAQKRGAPEAEQQVSDSSQAATAGAVKAEGGEYKCLVRATDGKRKISTALAGKQVARFLQSYSILQKAHMDALKTRQKERGAKRRENRALG